MQSFKLYNLSRILISLLLMLLMIGKTVVGQVHQVNLIVHPEPIVKFDARLSILNPMTLEFTDSSSITPGSITEWLWNFGDGDTSHQVNPTHTYAVSGYYDITLTVTSQTGCQSSLTRAILVGRENINIVVNSSIQCWSDNSFTYTGTNVPTGYNYLWNFGDGDTSHQANPTHHYADSGAFNVYLIISASGPSTFRDTAFTTVKVISTPNVYGIDHVCCSGEEVPAYHFTSDVTGTTYNWNRIIGQDAEIGLSQTSGTDSIPAFTAQNNTIHYLTWAYSVTPYYTVDEVTCAGQSEHFLITVNPVSHMDEITDFTYHNGQIADAYTFTGNIPDADYVWHFLYGDTIQGLPTTGSDEIPPFTAVNNENSPITALFEVIPSYSHANKTCTGIADTFSITIIPNNSVAFQNYVQVCDKPEIKLSLKNNNLSLPLYHKIVFSRKALDAGFSNMNDFILLSEDSIHITIPSNIQPDSYIGYVHIKNSYSNHYDSLDFVIDIMKKTIIIQQPASNTEFCNENSPLYLEVLAEGSNLSYQWYKDGVPITGAINAVYEKLNTNSSDFGSYEVEVSGGCGMLMSSVCNVSGNSIVILQKWDDVIFISHRDSAGNIMEIDHYQWYRVYADGSMRPISDKGQSQYYSERNIQGTFAVEVTFSDGTKKMSCPYTMIQTKSSIVNIYPNPGKSNEKITVFLDLSGDKTEGLIIDVFNELGVLIDRKIATDNITDFYLNVPPGMYIFRITEPDGQMAAQKVIIN